MKEFSVNRLVPVSSGEVERLVCGVTPESVEALLTERVRIIACPGKPPASANDREQPRFNAEGMYLIFDYTMMLPHLRQRVVWQAVLLLHIAKQLGGIPYPSPNSEAEFRSRIFSEAVSLAERPPIPFEDLLARCRVN